MMPKLTHLQCFIIQLLVADSHSARYLRSRLGEVGEAKSGPAFYQLMSRLEEAGWVHGWYDVSVIDGQTLKERRYESTRAGREAFRETADFYASIRKSSRVDEIVEVIVR